jgi:hypothetical protein
METEYELIKYIKPETITHLAKDQTISSNELRLLLLLMVNNEDVLPSRSDLASIFGVGLRAINLWKRKLKELGYVQWITKHGTDGKSYSSYIFKNIPGFENSSPGIQQASENKNAITNDVKSEEQLVLDQYAAIFPLQSVDSNDLYALKNELSNETLIALRLCLPEIGNWHEEEWEYSDKRLKTLISIADHFITFVAMTNLFSSTRVRAYLKINKIKLKNDKKSLYNVQDIIT